MMINTDILAAVVTMNASPWLLVLLLVALHLQCLYTKYYLVETGGRAASMPEKSIENTNPVVSSSKTSRAKTGSAKRKDKKTGRGRGRNKALTQPGKYQLLI